MVILESWRHVPQANVKREMRVSSIDWHTLEFSSVVTHQHGPGFHNGLQVDRASPDRVQVAQCGDCIANFQVGTFVLMCQVEFASVFVIAVSYHNAGIAEVGHHEEESLFDILELATGYYILA